MVLGKMKETAEAYLGHKVTHAVVTVPACECFTVEVFNLKFLKTFILQISMTHNAKLRKMQERSLV